MNNTAHTWVATEPTEALLALIDQIPDRDETVWASARLANACHITGPIDSIDGEPGNHYRTLWLRHPRHPISVEHDDVSALARWLP